MFTRVLVDISLDYLTSANQHRLIVQTRPVGVAEGGTVQITPDNIDISPLKQAIMDVVPPTKAKDFELFFIVKETPVNGVLQVAMAVFFCAN